MAEPAPINEMRFSRASRGQGFGSAPTPLLKLSPSRASESIEIGSPSCAAEAAARSPITGSSEKSASAPMTTSRFETAISRESVVERTRLRNRPAPSRPLCANRYQVESIM